MPTVIGITPAMGPPFASSAGVPFVPFAPEIGLSWVMQASGVMPCTCPSALLMLASARSRAARKEMVTCRMRTSSRFGPLALRPKVHKTYTLARIGVHRSWALTPEPSNATEVPYARIRSARLPAFTGTDRDALRLMRVGARQAPTSIGGGKMIPFWALIVLAGSAVVAVLLMLAARRFAAKDGFLADTVPAAAVFGVLGVAFAVLLAFVMFLAFENYIRAREGASREAVAISELDRITGLLPAPQGEQLRNDLVCYARAVISDEWSRMREGHESELVVGWLARMESTVDTIPLDSVRAEVAVNHWLDEMAVRREGRRARLAEATPSIPVVVWLTLVLGAGLTIAYLVVFADRRERWWTQAVMVGSLTALIVAGLLVVSFLDHPYWEDGAYIGPSEMATTLRLIEADIEADSAAMPTCDEQGRPT